MGLRAPEPRQPDERFYLTIAKDLSEHGVFSTARARGVLPPGSNAPSPDNYSGPLYPAVLAVAAQLSPGLERAMDCVGTTEGTAWSRCEGVDLSGLFALQAALGALALVGAFVAYRRLEPDRAAFAWVALLLLLAFGLQARLATSILPDGLFLAALMLFAGAFMNAVARERARGWILCGACLGLAALLRPSALYLLAMLAPFLLLRRGGVRAFVLAALGLGLLVGPWILRNAIVLDEIAFTGSYGGVILAQRVAYNLMTFQEWLAALIYWLPDFGDRLAAFLFEPGAYDRLRFDAADGFYALGNGTILRDAMAAAGAGGDATGVLIREWVLGAPFSHLASSVPIFLRGLWVGQYAGLVAILFAWVPFVTLADGAARRRLLFLAVPFLLLAGFHAGVTINIPRYNLALSLVYAAIFAHLALLAGDGLRRAAQRVRHRRSDI